MAWAAVIQRTASRRQSPAMPQTSTHRAQALRLGQQIILGALPAASAAQAYADLADARVRDCAAAAFADHGLAHKRLAVVAMGALGARQMTALSPLDLALVHEPDPGEDGPALAQACDQAFEAMACAVSGSPREALYTVNAHRGGALDALDQSLRGARPGRLLALPEVRMVWSSSPALSARLRSAIGHTLRRPQPPGACLRDSGLARRLATRRRPSDGAWDCAREPGGLDDIEALVRRLQVAHGAHGAPLVGPTGQALAALHQETFISDGTFAALAAAWTLQQTVAQILAAALPEGADPEAQPGAIQIILASATGTRSLPHLKGRLLEARHEALDAMAAIG